ncbi:MAG TPA: hypothetical protein VFF82_07150 [Rhodocyclaceae bacterium]|nr:hypothetical protein [Rhodocyclaceae bacterium]
MRRCEFLPLLAVAGVVLATWGNAWAEPLGRLFLTPERRAALERQRQLNVQEIQAIEGSVVSLDGVVTRSSGKSTVWVNQRPQNENTRGTGVATTVSPMIPGRAVLIPGEESPVSLKVGESINRGTGEKADGLGGGRVAVSRRQP